MAGKGKAKTKKAAKRPTGKAAEAKARAVPVAKAKTGSKPSARPKKRAAAPVGAPLLDIRDAGQASVLFQALLESAPDAMVIVDQRGRIVLVNAQAEALFGYSRAELLGQGMELLVPERFRPGHQGHREGYAQAPRPRAMGAGSELFARHKDGGEIPVEISLSPVATAGGPLVASAIRDISGRRQMEDELRARNEALRDQNARVEQANRLKSDFLANMSHELRTPLNSIIGFSELIHDGKAGPINPDQKDFLGDVLGSARHLLQLINDVLDLSKIEAGKVKLRPGPIDPDVLLQRGVGMLRAQAEARGIRLLAEVEAGLEGLEGDADRLQQVLNNYLSNAVKFSHDGGVVRLIARSAGPEAWRLEVRDQGIGIKPEDQERLFKDFVQLDAGAEKKYQGTGLGLSLTRKLVELHGGQVGLESRPGQGSLFYAEMPRKARL